MEQLNELLGQINIFFKSDSAVSWIAVGVLSLLITMIVKLFLLTVSKTLRLLAERTTSIWDDVAVDLLDGLKSWVMFVFTFYLFSHFFQILNHESKGLYIVFVSSCSIQIAIWGLHLIKNWRHNFLDRRVRQDPSASAALGLLYTVIQTIFLSMVVLIWLSSLGIDISALITGLGVGGIAVALAAQNVLGDLLASLSIVLDKPFVIGDFIVAGDEKGTVEHIGIKTTRLRSLSGEQLVFSNKDLLESRIKNFKRMSERRVVMNFGIIYGTPLEILEKIPTWVRGFIDSNKQLRFDRCHFDKLGSSSLDFELVFFVLNSEYNIFMDIKQKVLLEIVKKFTDEKVEFAFPTQTIYIEKNGDN
jgi:small-conductance mechanosensitive channel